MSAVMDDEVAASRVFEYVKPRKPRPRCNVLSFGILVWKVTRDHDRQIEPPGKPTCRMSEFKDSAAAKLARTAAKVSAVGPIAKD